MANHDIQQFKNLNDLNKFIELNYFSFEDKHEIASLLMQFKNKTDDETERQKIQWEIDFTFFDLKANNLFPLTLNYDMTASKTKSYPDLNEMDIPQFDYLKERITEIQFPALLARYNHLLWKAPKGIKNKKFAIEAIKNYMYAIGIYTEVAKQNDHYSIQHTIRRLFEHSTSLCNDVNEEVDGLKVVKNKILFDSVGVNFFTKHEIVKYMIETPKLFKSKDFESVLSIFEKEVKKEANHIDDFNLVNFQLPTALIVAQKTNADVKKWHNEVGLAHCRLADTETKQERYWLKLNCYADALVAFKLAGNSSKIEEITKLYSELKPEVTLNDKSENREKSNKHILSLLKKHESLTKEIVESETTEILKLPAEKVYATIACGNFFPTVKKVDKLSKDNFLFSQFATIIQFDKNKNISKDISKGSLNEEIFFTYNWDICFRTMPILKSIFFEGIKSGHLTMPNFLDFLANKTWVGKPYSIMTLSGDKISMDLIRLLIPSISDFFSQIQAHSSSQLYKPNFTLCIDSLTLKLETLMRNFCQRVNIPTSISRTKGIQEIYLHEVFESDIIKHYYSDNDLLFFKYLFSTEGLNIRNNVAHGFYLPHDYTSDTMLLLISALLRIAKFDFKTKTD